MAKDLLLEIGTEEIPAKFMPGTLAQLKEKAAAAFSEERISYANLETLGTPRRMVLVVRGLAEQQQDLHKEVKGPAKKAAFDEQGNPSKAAQGFARSQGIDVAELVVKSFEGGEYVFAVITGTGQKTADILPGLLTNLITGFTFPKSMRWADYDFRFVRPIRWLVALFGNNTVNISIADVETGNVTFGHRFLSKGPLVVNSLEEYLTTLERNYVIVDPLKREAIIREQIASIAKQQGGTASIDEDLLEEVIYLIEYPTALFGRFEEAYLELPDPVLITPMREHQRYFPVYGADGKLLNGFITVRNGTTDHIDIVRAGNEKVLRARLADAKFFWEEDRKAPLADKVEALKTIVFQEGLGTMWDKTERMKDLATLMAQKLRVAENEKTVAVRAATLAKADLMTTMVKEFTELQGVMGREYARLSGENPLVAEAIFEHYLPRFAGDVLPKTIGGKLVGVADKLDTIVGTFSRGLIPTGSQDPYALRRQALGIVNIIIDSRFHISFTQLIYAAMDLLQIKEVKREKLQINLQEFFQLRLRNILADQGVRYDIVDAVLAEGSDDIYATYQRAHALATFLEAPNFGKTLMAYTRVLNLAKKANAEYGIDSALFQDAAEISLYKVYQDAKETILRATETRDYAGALVSLTALQAPIDTFFAAVMVMVEDEKVKQNRLALLKSIAGLMDGTADLSKIVV
jgi:glycyl-tRNA synthetase beta chain